MGLGAVTPPYPRPCHGLKVDLPCAFTINRILLHDVTRRTARRGAQLPTAVHSAVGSSGTGCAAPSAAAGKPPQRAHSGQQRGMQRQGLKPGSRKNPKKTLSRLP